jgi:hypothetical protein
VLWRYRRLRWRYHRLRWRYRRLWRYRRQERRLWRYRLLLLAPPQLFRYHWQPTQHFHHNRKQVDTNKSYNCIAATEQYDWKMLLPVL